MITGIDVSLLHLVQSYSHPLLDGLMKALTELGSPVFWLLVIAVIYWMGKENEGFYLANVVLFSSVVVGALKILVARPRPDPTVFRVIEGKWDSFYSFPSGHSTLIASMYSYLRKEFHLHWQWLLGLTVLLVMYSRMYLGVHYLTDVITGTMLGLGIGWGVFKLKEAWINKGYKLSKLQDEAIVIALVVIGLIVLFFLNILPLIGTLLGFYCGFFLFKEIGLKQTLLNLKQVLPKTVIGFLGIGLALSPMNVFKFAWLNPQIEFVLYFITGFWVSFLLPLAWEKIFKHCKT